MLVCQGMSINDHLIIRLAALRAKAVDQATSITLKKMTVAELKTNADDSRQAENELARLETGQSYVLSEIQAISKQLRQISFVSK